MLSKQDIFEKALSLDFGDAGFTTAEPFNEYKEKLEKRKEGYDWTKAEGIDLENGYDPTSVMAESKSIIVLIEPYFKGAFPRSMEAHFGRCYLDDDRVKKDGLEKRIRAFRDYLSDGGIKSKVSFSLPHRAAAARAGLGSFGKNCFFYAHRVARGGSWVLPVVIAVDVALEPDEPSLEMNCPTYCRNACISACPTRALQGNGTIDPKKCISYLTYHGDDITPLELREAMGLYVYGCDRCQNVCPRNQPWLSKQLPINENVAVKALDFELSKLLHMDIPFFKKQIWPHMFYIHKKNLWKWKMNVARVMGNTLDPSYLLDLEKAFVENDDERVKGMIVWAMGKLGNQKTVELLQHWAKDHSGLISDEINLAIDTLSLNNN